MRKLEGFKVVDREAIIKATLEAREHEIKDSTAAASPQRVHRHDWKRVCLAKDRADCEARVSRGVIASHGELDAAPPRRPPLAGISLQISGVENSQHEAVLLYLKPHGQL
ncbi:hypothetical protein EYF80_003761 [Liparis tanakae]|uniref:Uncharacterized protein n=1 Tax=Liparis tanakae TaxID=230148 RepID=A0A4Z2J7A9_9TELE|nr:hypothetical protein EYF80_003761 [Liparis tanakae]